jgi:integrase/recombinase XerD
MTDLRKRMIQDLQLRGYSERTQEMYVRAVRQLAEHYHTSPDQITEEQLRDYFLYNKNVRQWSRTASTIALCGIKFFFTYTIQKDWTTFKLVRPPKEKTLPSVLSRKEVRRIFKQIRFDRHRICLMAIYSLGLRLQEGTHLQVSDIDSDRMFVHIHKGKGNKDRYVPLPKRTLELLREFWKTHRNPVLLFPAPGRGGISMATTDKPIPKSSIQIAFRKAKIAAGVHKPVSVHHLRHSYAIHLLEAGVDIRLIQEYLGHNDPRTTLVYTHLTKKTLKSASGIIDQIMVDL